jgi:hypothetical protein
MRRGIPFLISISVLFTSISSCTTKSARLKAYEYEKDLRKYLQALSLDAPMAKKYLMILYANACNKCTGELLDQIARVERKQDFEVILVYPPIDKQQRGIVEAFDGRVDSLAQIIDYELNISSSTLFFIENGRFYNQTTLNETSWRTLKESYGF